MAFNLTTFNGMAVTGLTSPTYTVTQDINNGLEKSWVVTAAGGTQPGVNIHSNSNPFSLKVQKTRSVRGAPIVGPNGYLKGGGYNIYKASIIKGVLPLAGQSPQIAIGDFTMRIPAGSDLADRINIAAMLSCLCGFFAGQGTPLYDLATTNNI
jgi:hypothetical protein